MTLPVNRDDPASIPLPDPRSSNEQRVWWGHAEDHNTAHRVVNSRSMGYRSGAWYQSVTGGFQTITPSLNQLRVGPFIITEDLAFDRIGVDVVTGQASSTYRLGVYANDRGRPAALLLDGGTVSTATAGFKELTISISLEAGVYWLAGVPQAGTAPGVRGFQGAAFQEALAVAQTNACFQQSGVTGALPDPFAGAVTDSPTIRIPMRAV